MNAEHGFVVGWQSQDGADWLAHLDGVAWHDAPAPPAKHEHWAQTRGLIRLELVDRCPCGAIHFGGLPGWAEERPEQRRVGVSPATTSWWRRLFGGAR